MQEIELKFQIPEASLAALHTEARAGGATPCRLQAAYFDTPGRQLAAARAALRLRHEGPQGWVQTLKAQGATVLQRLEHNLPRGLSADRPSLDLAAHLAQPEAAAALARALGWPDGAALAAAEAAGPGVSGLAVTFGTDITRQAWRVRTGPGGRSEVELALDEGAVLADGRREPVCELELELCEGEVADLLALAAGQVARHGLWLDVRSKAERGERLATGEWLPELPLVLRQRSTRPDTVAGWRPWLATALEAQMALGSLLACPQWGARLPAGHVQAWHRGLGELHQGLGRAQAAGVAGLDPDWAESLALLLPPLDTLDPLAARPVWQRAARSARCQGLLLGLLGWVAASAPEPPRPVCPPRRPRPARCGPRRSFRRIRSGGSGPRAGR